jgi:hypothetical protein
MREKKLKYKFFLYFIIYYNLIDNSLNNVFAVKTRNKAYNYGQYY